MQNQSLREKNLYSVLGLVASSAGLTEDTCTVDILEHPKWLKYSGEIYFIKFYTVKSVFNYVKCRYIFNRCLSQLLQRITCFKNNNTLKIINKLMNFIIKQNMHRIHPQKVEPRYYIINLPSCKDWKMIRVLMGGTSYVPNLYSTFCGPISTHFLLHLSTDFST